MKFIVDTLTLIADWSNNNSGFLTLIIFIITLILGWTSGIFRALLRKPNFIIEVLPGPTFCCTMPTGRKYNGHDTHLTAIALYLSITNTGSAPAEVSGVHIAYHNYSFRYSFLWFWLRDQITALKDFQVAIGNDDIKVYPFLFQESFLLPTKRDTYLRQGQKTNGVVYFEQRESWGSFLPRARHGKIKIKICVLDSYRRKYKKLSDIPFVDIEEAKNITLQ